MALWHQQVFEGNCETSEFHRRILEEYPGATEVGQRNLGVGGRTQKVFRDTIQVPWMEEGYPDRTEKGTNMSQA